MGKTYAPSMTHPQYLCRDNPTDDTLEKLLKLGPVHMSPKLDGMRCVVVPEVNLLTGRIRTNREEGQVGLRSKSLKPFPNQFLPELFNHPALMGLDGELCVGEINDELLLPQTTSVIMSNAKPLPPSTKFVVFDSWYAEADRVYKDRYQDALAAVSRVIKAEPKLAEHLMMLEDTLAVCLGDIYAFEEQAVEAGFEGICIRSAYAYYKQGRTTMREHNSYKLKRYVDSEATLLEVFPAMENQNEAQTNELGRTKRSSAKAGLVAKDTAGRVLVTSDQFGEFFIGSGWNAQTAQWLWDNRASLVASKAQIKYKYSPQGVRSKPLKPIYIEVRAKGF